ncbi:MAG: 4-alpha-glucanotransferase [Porphyromonadaceae bacterium]|nr:4-alpha-glucanotransferase [Porphyromonadaceae bacterium]
MDITCSITYRAEHGHRLCICGSVRELGGWDEEHAIDLSQESEDRWVCTVRVDGRRKEFAYYYLVKDAEGKVLRREWKRMHRLSIKAPFRSIYMDDRWIDRPKNAPFYSSAFYDVIYRQTEHLFESMGVVRSLDLERVVLQIYAPTVPSGSRLYLSGSTPKLGMWDVQRAIPMDYLGKGEWTTYIDMDRSLFEGLRVEFKFLISDEKREAIRWEEGQNRHFILPPQGAYDAIYVAGMSFSDEHYRPRFAGMVAPLFSLRSEEDCGIGDFGVLKKAVDWAASSGLRALQLLPINDTTYYRDWRDSYPYNAISVDALSPIFADLKALPPLKAPEGAKLLQRAEALRLSPTVLYPEVQQLKEDYLWLHYLEHGGATMKKRPYKQFALYEAEWLMPYTAFCLLRDKHPGLGLEAWGEYASYDPQQVTRLLEHPDNRDRANYYKYVQFVLHEQLLSVRTYAEERGILLKGDIPIGVSPQSVEVWVHPELFHLNLSAGAPPDDFAIDGQNWGFPTYNWQVMQRDGMLWWRRRFERMSNYFKAFRIDHILGFFRIWEIPRHQYSGLLGHFSPALPYSLNEWRQQLGLTEGDMLEHLIYPCLHENDLEGEAASLWQRCREAGLLLRIADTPYYRLSTTSQREAEHMARELLGQAADISPIIALCHDVALIEDNHTPGLYHPRIALQTTQLYSRWTREQQARWDRINEDYFYHRHNDYWRQTAMKRLLPLLESTDMLVCAEDLGMIPAVVPEVLGGLQILTLDLERMPKETTPTGWTPMSSIPYTSVCTTSTHDMPPLRLWWQSLGEVEQQRYLATQLRGKALPPHPSDEEVCRAIVGAHLSSEALLSIIPLADLMSMDKRLHLQRAEDEQINHPEDPYQRWEWRMPLSLERLQSDYPDWSENLRTMLQAYGRD